MLKKYVVKPGESLYQISKKTGVRLPLLIAANPQLKNPSNIVPGTTIVIPELGKPAKGGGGKTTKSAKSAMAGGTSGGPIPPYFGFVWPHQVQHGETWDSIASKYGVHLEQLQHVNPHQSGALAPNSMLYVPTAAVSAAHLPGAPASGAASGLPEGYGLMPSQAGMPGYGPMPGQTGMPTGMAMSTPPAGSMQPSGQAAPGMFAENGFGPHSHNPYRLQGDSWYVEADEQEAFLRFDEQRDWPGDEMRSDEMRATEIEREEQSLPTKDDEGWSTPFTVDLREG